MRWGVITFPGSCDEQDVYDSLKREMGQKVKLLWHKPLRRHGTLLADYAGSR